MGNSPDNAGDATASKDGGERRRRSALPGCLVVIGTILMVFVGLPYAFLVLLFWAAEGSWDFEGDRNFRYWLFVSGKRVEKLGLVAPTEKPVRYSFRGSDGNFPGWTVVHYESKAAPAEVIDAYAKRCESLKAKVIERPVRAEGGRDRRAHRMRIHGLPHGRLFRRTDIVIVRDGGRPAGLGHGIAAPDGLGVRPAIVNAR